MDSSRKRTLPMDLLLTLNHVRNPNLKLPMPTRPSERLSYDACSFHRLHVHCNFEHDRVLQYLSASTSLPLPHKHRTIRVIQCLIDDMFDLNIGITSVSHDRTVRHDHCEVDIVDLPILLRFVISFGCYWVSLDQDHTQYWWIFRDDSYCLVSRRAVKWNIAHMAMMSSTQV